MSKGIKVIATALILVFYCTLTYSSRWTAIAGSTLIILSSRVVWSKNGMEVIGLRVPRRQIGISLLLFCMVLFCSFRIVSTIARHEGVILVPVYEKEEWPSLLVHTIGQTLNEEMVLGALFLKAIKDRFRFLRPSVTSTGVALIFSALHYAFYGLRPPQSANYGILSMTTLVSLFAMGVVRNNCILSTGNVGYAWALHLGWNIAFIDGSFYLPAPSIRYPEPAMFNLILGHGTVATVASLFMALSFLLLAKGSSEGPSTDGGRMALG
jgi:hypothetical protein